MPRTVRQRYRLFDDVIVTDNCLYAIMFVLKLNGLNVFNPQWYFSLKTGLNILLTAFFWIVISGNFIMKVNDGFKISTDAHFLYITAGVTNGAVQTYMIVKGGRNIRRLYNAVFHKFSGWVAKEDLEVYLKKSTKLHNLVIYTGCQLYLSVVMMMFRPLSDASLFPIPRDLVALPAVDYDHLAGARLVMYIVQILMMLSLTGLIFSTDSLFVSLCVRLAAHLHLLGERLEAAGRGRRERGRWRPLRGAVRLYVDRYNELCGCVERMNRVYAPQNTYLPLYTIVFSTCALLAYDGTWATVYCLALAVSHMSRLLIYCVPADIMLTETDYLYRRLMWCGFPEWRATDQRQVLFIMQGLRRGMPVRCGLGDTFSMALWYSTMSTTYSLFNTFSRFKRRN